MKIIIATTQVPFIAGGAEIQATSLKTALEKEGHLVEIVTIPFKGYASDVLISIPFTRMLELAEIHGHKVDRLIGLKFPSYLIPHPNKVVWLIHQQRDAYDLWESGHSALLNNPSGIAIREAIRRMDNICMNEAKFVYAESKNVARRLMKFNSFNAAPLYHPPKNEERFFCDRSERYLFFPSRLTPLKRQDLLLKALSLTKNPVKVVLAGTSDTPDYENVIQALIKDLKIEDRVQFLGGISEEQKFSLYSKALAVIYPPYDEDYGYVTLEAMLSSKPVITCSDSGGSLEFIQDRKSGWIAEPYPEGLADILDEVWENPTQAEKLGIAARDYYCQLGISWKSVITKLCE